MGIRQKNVNLLLLTYKLAMKVNAALFLALPLLLLSCGKTKEHEQVRFPVDTIGFATKDYQVDSILNRISRIQGDFLESAPNIKESRLAICPHDDHTYVGWLYPATLRNITAKTVILFGVAHKAMRYGLQDKLVFESFDSWKGPFGNIKISKLRNQIYKLLPQNDAIKHDSMHIVEHSIESMLPFLQKQNRDIEIVPILVPYMSMERIEVLAEKLARALDVTFKKEGLSWGSDVAIVVTTDAVHYGDMDWGGKNYAPFGADSAGYKKAKALELEILNTTLVGDLSPEMVRNFYSYTVDSSNYMEYKWTWCGRYSIPFALLTALNLNKLQNGQALVGVPVGYSTSIENTQIPVEDLGMGHTAPANIRHWVGYAAVVYH
ncbi:MAG: hypothetical protein PWR03_235 [Tenuifilum sp.]|jgi:AmmeMemoRadiSam system protein B|nr:hypothetical protein [Tenuifilum sp.]